ncbi:MAG: glycosyltransferase [Planctomycetota bacterium]|jgi:glycosyltransferase involved in cell wall biosynthesis
MKVSLLFLTYNRRGIVARCFQSMASTLRDPRIEWRVLDNGSTDGTAEWLQRFAAQHGNVHVTLRADNTDCVNG